MLVLSDLERTSIGYYSIDIATQLKNIGANVVVVSAGGILLKELIRSNITHIQLPVNSTDFFTVYSNSKKLSKIIMDFNIDIVHANSYSSSISCMYACKKTNTKFVTTIHYTKKLSFFSLKRIFSRYIIKSDSVIAPSLFAAKYLVDEYKINPNKINVIGNWFDSDAFSPNSVSTERIINITNTMSLPEDKRIISIIGTYKNSKDISVMIDAVGKLQDKDIILFIITNSKKEKSNLIGKINKLNLQDYVNILDDNIDVAAIYSLSDVIVNISSIYNSFDLHLLEAEAMGRIIVSTDRGSVNEIIIDSKTGKIVHSDSVNSLIDGINWALGLSQDERKNISNEASKYAYFHFSKSAKIDNIIKLYNQLSNT